MLLLLTKRIKIYNYRNGTKIIDLTKIIRNRAEWSSHLSNTGLINR